MNMDVTPWATNPPEPNCRIGRVITKGRENVVSAGIQTRLDVPPSRILAGAAECGLESVVVIGYDADGGEYFASSAADGGDVLWLLERCKRALLSTAD